jgi:hypothetical protein
MNPELHANSIELDKLEIMRTSYAPGSPGRQVITKQIKGLRLDRKELKAEIIRQRKLKRHGKDDYYTLA